jgi:hydrogenase maturation protease
MSRVLVLGWGNPGRGDDALGPRLLEQLEADAASRPEWARHGFVSDFQLQPEHALDLDGAAQVLFVDASASIPEAFRLSRVAAAPDGSFTTHALSPQALLAVREQIAGEKAPPAWLLAVRGDAFELGAPLSAHAEARLSGAAQLARELLSHPDPAYWDRATARAAPCTN